MIRDMAIGTNPFPGMNPWLESSWGDVHHELISELRRQTVPQLPPDLFAVVEESVYLIGGDLDETTDKPDVTVFGHTGNGDPGTTTGGVAVAEPVRLTVRDDPVTEGHIEIRHLGSGQPLIAVVEVLSRTNKGTADGRAAYLDKRRSYRAAGVTVVEVDLLRGGRDLSGVADVGRLDPRLPSAYRAAVRRGSAGTGRHTLDLYPIPLRDRLPAIAVPLRAGDPSVVLDLQPPIDLVYQLGGYGRRIDYGRPPDPPLSADDAAWAAGRVAAAAVI